MFYILKRVLRVLFYTPSPQRRRKRPRSTETVIRPANQHWKTRRPTNSQPIELIEHEGSSITGRCYVVDGDTIEIGRVSIRLFGIDAPELDHPWGQKAKWELINLCKGQEIKACFENDASYNREVATCYLPDGRDLSAEMVKRGMALDWPKFSGGKYAHLEPEGVRKKHWKAAARQRGHMHVFNK